MAWKGQADSGSWRARLGRFRNTQESYGPAHHRSTWRLAEISQSQERRSAEYAAGTVREFLPQKGPANPSEVGVLFFVFFCSFDFCRDRRCHRTRE